MSPQARFLTVVETYPGYCQVCHDPSMVARIAVAGWQHHGTVCSRCLTELADEAERRGKGLVVQKGSTAHALAAIGGGNGYASEPVRR